MVTRGKPSSNEFDLFVRVYYRFLIIPWAPVGTVKGKLWLFCDDSLLRSYIDVIIISNSIKTTNIDTATSIKKCISIFNNFMAEQISQKNGQVQKKRVRF